MMKTARLAIMTWLGLELVTMAAYEYVWIDTNTGVYKPARVESDQHSNVQATTGRFDVLWVAGVRITGASTTIVTQTDAPISGLETDGQVPGTITYRDVPTRYSGASFWYPFDYSSEVILDSSGEGIHAVNRPASAPMTWTNYSLMASKIGENYLVQVNSNGVLQSAPSATWGAWVKFDTEATNNNVLLSAGGVSNRVALWMDATNLYSVVCGASSTSLLTYAYGAGLVTGTWHRVVSSYEKKGVSGTATAEHRLWLDGVMVAQDAAAQNFFVANSTRFMALNTDGTPTANKFVDGQIDDVFAAREVWSPLTVTNDWTAGRSMLANEYETSTPYPVSAVSPSDGGSTATGAAQVLRWSASSVAQEYRLYSWTNNVAPTTVVSITSNSYNIGTTYNNRTNYWMVAASNPYGQATSSVFVFYPYTFNTNLYTNMGFYADFKTEGTTLVADKNPRLGVDNFTRVGSSIAWADYRLALNPDAYVDDHLKTTSTVAYTATSDGAFSIGFWFRFSTVPSGKISFMTESQEPYSIASLYRRTSLCWSSTDGIVWTLHSTNATGSRHAAALWAWTPDTAWHHLAVGAKMEGASTRMVIWFDGVKQVDEYDTVSGFGLGAVVSPIYIGLNPSIELGSFYYGETPHMEIDDLFVTDRLLSTVNDIVPMFNQNRSLNATY